MSEMAVFPWILAAWLALACLSFVTLLWMPAPYGRYVEQGARRTVPSRWGWVVMEAAAVLVFVATFVTGRHRHTAAAIVFFALWMAHYLQRAFVYPFLQRAGESRMPVAIVACALLFNLVNGYLNGRYLFELSGGYPDDWLRSWRFGLGVALFVVGYAINRQADWTLRNLRPTGGGGYAIPHGGLFRWVSCPNYLGELVLWIGWAVATWSLPGLSFAVWTAANLVPRSRSHHCWYRMRFPDYPRERRALVPGLW